MIIGEPWPQSQPAKTFVATDGSEMTIEVYSAGLLISDAGGASQLPHVEDTEDPDIIKIGTSFFRRLR